MTLLTDGVAMTATVVITSSFNSAYHQSSPTWCYSY